MQKKLFVIFFSFIGVCSIVALVFSAYMGAVHMRTFYYYAETNFDPALTERELLRAVLLICASVLCFLCAATAIAGIIFLLFPALSSKIDAIKASRNIAVKTRKAQRKADRIAELEEELDKLKKDGE